MGAEDNKTRHWQRIIAGLGLLTGLILFILPAPDGWPPKALSALGLVAIAVGFWSTEAIPVHLTSFIIFFLALVLAVGPASVVFSGFHSGAVWLVFAGVVIGIAVQQTGLGARIAEAIVARFGHSYIGLILGIGLTGFGTAFLMPSAVGRIVIMTPVIAAIAERLGYAENSRGRAGMILAFCFCTVMPAMGILPATVPNVVFAGSAESIHGIVLRYTDFMTVHLSVAGLGCLTVLLFLAWFLFRETPPNGKVITEASPERTAVSGQEIRLGLIMVLTLGLWMTDKLHGIAPAWIGLGAAITCLLPVVKLVPPRALTEKVNYGPWFYVAGIIGLGALVADTGLAKFLGAALIELVGFDSKPDVFNFGTLTLIGGLLTFALNPAGIPAVLTPMAENIAQATGWPLTTVLMTQVTSFFIVFLPYQLAPILTGILIGRVPMVYGLRMSVIFTLIYLIVIMPLNFLWWQHLGMFGS